VILYGTIYTEEDLDQIESGTIELEKAYASQIERFNAYVTSKQRLRRTY
jgi:hypothetical protein